LNKIFCVLEGNIRVYPFDKNNPDGPLRTKENYKEDLRIGTRGIIGKTVMNKLSNFNPVENICIDYMHSLLEGVIKGLFRLWFGQEYVYSDCNGKKVRNKFSLRQYINQIDERLLKMKPPSFVPSAPRSVDLWGIWRAHEFLYFIIYYSLCVFHEIMNYEYYQHLMLLVIAMENLLNNEIKKDELDIIHRILIKFVEQMEILYPKRSMLSGTHELLHLVQCTKDFGPLNYCNCFEFEELNRKFLMLIKGNDLIGEEFIKLFSIAKALNIYSSELNNSKFKEFISKHSALKTSNFKKVDRSEDSFIGKTIIINDREVSNLLKDFDGSYIEDLAVSYIASFKEVKYTTTSDMTRFCDYCIKVKNVEDYGFIKYFIKKDYCIFVFCQKIVKIHEPFYYDSRFKNYKSKLFICDITEEYFITKINFIEKVCFMKINDLSFISTFRGGHLFS
jgi:hypothetical protein